MPKLHLKILLLIELLYPYFKIQKKRNSKITDFRDLVGADEVAYDNVVNKIPCGSLYRWPYKYYHSNKDNIKSVDKKSFVEYFNVLKELIYLLENNSVFIINLKRYQNYLIQE